MNESKANRPYSVEPEQLPMVIEDAKEIGLISLSRSVEGSHEHLARGGERHGS